MVRAKLFPILILVMTGVCASAMAADDFEEGKDYTKLASPQPTTSRDKVEVIEFFSYGCPHCAHFEPVLDEWLTSGKPDNVVFKRIPVAWNQGFEAFARVYYAAQAQGAPTAADAAMFHLLHEEKPPQLTLQTIADVYARFGVDKDAFMATFGSDEVTAKVDEAKSLTRAYRVTGVPALIVDGTYEVPSPAGGDFKRMLATADYLVGKSER